MPITRRFSSGSPRGRSRTDVLTFLFPCHGGREALPPLFLKIKEPFMTRHFILPILLLLFICATAGAAEQVENPKECGLCGMDRAAFARSRMVITYADGATTGVCSLHCATEDMKRNKDKQVKSLQVADYPTRELID